MVHEGLVLHAHTYSTSMETYRRISGLHDEMIVTQTDIWIDDRSENKSEIREVEFISAMEHRKYPLYTSMYHPEYQLLEFTNDKKWLTIESAATDEIAYRFSLKLHQIAK